MAAEILKGMSFPTLVAAVEINAASRKVVQNKNCQIEGLKVAADGRIEFQQKDNALPFFPDGDAKNILQWVPDPRANERLPPESHRPQAGPV